MQQEAEGLSLSSTLRPAGISAGRVQAESSSSFSADWAISFARLRGQPDRDHDRHAGGAAGAGGQLIAIAVTMLPA